MENISQSKDVIQNQDQDSNTANASVKHSDSNLSGSSSSVYTIATRATSDNSEKRRTSIVSLPVISNNPTMPSSVVSDLTRLKEHVRPIEVPSPEAHSDSDPCTALMRAAEGGHIDACKALLKGGADGCAALTQAAKDGKLDVLNILLKAGADGCTALFRAAEDGNISALQAFIKVGADKVRDSEGNTALMRAAKDERLDVLQVLIKAKADIHAHNSYGQTALMRAADYGKVGALKILIDAGANINACA